MLEDKMVHYPQDEMTTFLLPVTFGCAYGKCAFCTMYKGDPYGEVSLSEIEMQLRHGGPYTEKVFLTGADPLSIGFDRMKRILDMIHHFLPWCACVASYASVRSISNFSVQELDILHNAGLRLLYIGFESGSDEILKWMLKGHTVQNALEQARKLNTARLAFNTVIMYGIAGKGKSVENARATAEMINQFETNRVITMSLTVFEGTKLSKMIQSGDFVPADYSGRLLEIETLLEHLRPRRQMIFDTTHPTNIIRIKGTLPQDRDRLIAEVLSHARSVLG
jgi:radical SAM superfamily enzyme YgiQ (UPF0313 family)